MSLSGSRVTGIHARPLIGALFIQPLECRIFGIINVNCTKFKAGDRDSRAVYVLPCHGCRRIGFGELLICNYFLVYRNIATKSQKQTPPFSKHSLIQLHK